MNLCDACKMPISSHDSLESAVDWIGRWLIMRSNENEKLSAVFDIDATLLGQQGRIEEVCVLFDHCKTLSITPFIVTARSSLGREATHKDLERNGITGYKRLFMHPAEKRLSHVEHAGLEKKKSRMRIESHNYVNCINIGDAWHDHFSPIPRELTRFLGREMIYVFITSDSVVHLKLPG